MTIKVRSVSFNRLIPSSKNLSFSVLPSEKIVPPSSINIHYPDKMTQSTLVKIVMECEYNSNSSCLYISQNGSYNQFEKADKNSTIDQMKILQDGCVVTTLCR